MKISNADRRPPRLAETLAAGDVDLWRVDLDADRETIGSLRRLLSDDEIRRADKFVFAKDRDRFTAGRGILRTLIGAYLGLDAERVRFSYNAFGKPRVAADGGELRFNVSHSRGVGLIAVARNREVGVDIEFVDPNFDVAGVAPGAFPPAVATRLCSLPDESRAAAFFECWTRKEAALKAIGDGLSSSAAEQSAVAAVIDREHAVFTTESGGTTKEWTLATVAAGDAFRAALAIEGELAAVRQRRGFAIR